MRCSSPVPADLGATRWLRTVVVSACALGISAGFSRFSFAIALPQMTEEVFDSYSTAGAMLALNFGVYMVAVALVRRYGARVDPTRLAIVGVALTVLGLVVVAAAPTASVVALGTIALGLGAAGGFVPVTSIVVEVAPPPRRGVAMGIGLAGIGLSIVLTGQLVGAIERASVASPWRWAFAAEAAIGAVVLALAIAFLPRLTPDADADPSLASGAFRRLPRRWLVLATYASFGLAVSTYTGFLVSALQEDRGFSTSHAVTLSSLMGGAMAAGVVVGHLSDRIGRRLTMVLGTSTIGLCALVVPFGVEPWLALTALAAGVFINGVGAVVGAYLGDHLTTPEVTSAMGVLTLAMAIAQIVAPPVGGWLADATGSFLATFLFAAATAAIAALAASRLPRDQEGLRRVEGRGRRFPLAE